MADLESSAAPPVPWTQDYLSRRTRLLEAALSDQDLLGRFRSGESLQAGYGVGLDERLVELPWMMAHLPPGPGRLLDAGSSTNHLSVLVRPELAAKQVHIVTLSPERESFIDRGVSYLFEDLRALPFKDSTYDIVVSISTIEHVGCDNTFYVGAKPPDWLRRGGPADAVRELRRVLRPGGVLLLSVPFGRYEHHGVFEQFDRSRLAQVLDALGPVAAIDESFFRYDAAGWQRATPEACEDCRYVAWVSDLMRTGRWPSDPTLESDFAANARAVACVRVVA